MTYRTVEEARAAGLEHPGCRHRYSVWIEGISRKPEPQGKPEDYEQRTQQRSLERQVRAWKRREAAGDPKAPAYVKKWQKELRDHVDEHGLKRRYDRENPLVGKAPMVLEVKKAKSSAVSVRAEQARVPAPSAPAPAPAPASAPASASASAPASALAPARIRALEKDIESFRKRGQIVKMRRAQRELAELRSGVSPTLPTLPSSQAPAPVAPASLIQKSSRSLDDARAVVAAPKDPDYRMNNIWERIREVRGSIHKRVTSGGRNPLKEMYNGTGELAPGDALWSYVRHTDSTDLNSWLRGLTASFKGGLIDSRVMKRWSDGMDRAFKKYAITLDEPIVVNRWAKKTPGFNLDDLAPGDVLSDRGWVSTTAADYHEFAHKADYQIEIHLPAGAKALPGADAEFELILERGASFQVVSVVKKGKKKVFTVAYEPPSTS